MLKILKIDLALYQLTKIFLLFSNYKKAIFLAKLSISVNKKIIYVKLLALIYAQNRNLKMFINTYKNNIKTKIFFRNIYKICFIHRIFYWQILF
jgi:hypothetical protein